MKNSLKSNSSTTTTDNALTTGSSDSPGRDLLTVEQAAQVLQLSSSSIRSYIREGKLPAFRIAGLRKVLIARPALLALLEPARTGAGA